MRYFFESTDNQNKLVQELESWQGTPYRHMCAIKGRAVDCIHYIKASLEACGLGPYSVPEYSQDWFIHTQEERLLNILRAMDEFIDVINKPPMNGDIQTYRMFRKGATSHLAVFFNGRIYQAINKYGVRKVTWQTWKKFRTGAFRVTA